VEEAKRINPIDGSNNPVSTIKQGPDKHWWQTPNAPAWAMFALTAVYVIVSILLVFVATDQFEITKETLIADKRAFVFVDNLDHGWILDRTTKLYDWRFRLRFKNSGGTPTKNLTSFLQCEIRDTPLPENYNFDQQQGRVGRGFIAPNFDVGGGEAPPPPRVVSPQDILAVQAGKKFLYVWGWIKYFDVFPNTPEHSTHFCWQFTITGNPLTFDPNARGQPPVAGTLAFNNIQCIGGNDAN
jgi:hypothetical protein